MDIRAGLQRLVDIGLEADMLAAANRLVGRDDRLAVGIQYPVLDGLRGKAAKHHRVHGADAGAGQHGVDRFRNHRHVDADTVAFADIA
jgi:hypothetical protein